MSTTITNAPESSKPKLVSLFDKLRSGGWEPGQATGWEGDSLVRNYEILLDSGTSWKNLPLTCVAVELLAQHQPDTVRGNMYLVVSAGWLPDTSRKSYGRIQRLLNRLRENGTLPMDWIVDNVRQTIKPSSWTGLEDFQETVRNVYRRDFWASLPEHIEVIAEKDTIAGKIAPVTREYDVPLHPIRGYCSTSFAWSIAKNWPQIEKPITVYYVGDHDPSGRDLERNIREKLARYAEREFAWQRLAVLEEHFDEYDILALDPKPQDKRYHWFIENFGDRCAEVEAVPANDLRQILRDAIESHIPAGEWERLQQVEQAEQEHWEATLGRLRQ